jgi:hypothetical protein
MVSSYFRFGIKWYDCIFESFSMHLELSLQWQHRTTFLGKTPRKNYKPQFKIKRICAEKCAKCMEIANNSMVHKDIPTG